MKKYGIWGLGVVGTSIIRFLHAKGHRLSVYDTRTLTHEEVSFLIAHQVHHYLPHEQHAFFEDNDIIIPSPGVALTPAKSYQSKIVHELDLFGSRWHKPLIAVTGSLGKTTLVTLLTSVLKANNHATIMGGNIGIPMLDLLDLQNTTDYGILELSSFQLEYATQCAPDLAIITNLYANHLDRHETMESYFKAKAQIFMHQRPGQQALLPFNLIQRVHRLIDRSCTYFSKEMLTQKDLLLLNEGEAVYTFEGTSLVKTVTSEHNHHITTKIDLSEEVIKRGSTLLPETWLIILAASDMLGLLTSTAFTMPTCVPLEHRIEFVGEHGGRLFYNDSKSTIVEATIAAVTALAPKKVHLMLGGVSKGVNRTPLLADLKGRTASIACFGKEAQPLDESCRLYGIPSSAHETLDAALNACIERSNVGDIILLSPSGASYDLYKDYLARGKHFKQLITQLYA